MKNDLFIGTIWTWEHWQAGQLVNHFSERNLCTLEGRNKVLGICFGGASQISTWYIAVFEDDHTPASGDNYATPGFTECTAYEGATRPGFTASR